MSSVHSELPLSSRPAWCEIDLDALAHNVRVVRAHLPPKVRFYAVCKNNAYGCGARESARTMLEAGADAFAVSDPQDAERIRAAGVYAPILLYASTTPDAAAAVAEMGLIATVHDFAGLEAFASIGRRLDVYVELDCGYGRLGFLPREWGKVFERLGRVQSLNVVGIYTHMASVDDAAEVARQAQLFTQAQQHARVAGFDAIEVMAASSRVMIGYPELNLTAVNPGRMLYGMMEAPWHGKWDLRPVIRSVKSRVLQVKDIPSAFSDPLNEVSLQSQRSAVIAFGFKDGLPRQPAGGSVLVRGQRCRIVGPRATEHTIVDVTGVPGVAAGDEVVILGSQGEETIDAHEAVASYGMEMIELLPRMSLSVPRIYVRNGEPAYLAPPGFDTAHQSFPPTNEGYS